MQRAGRLVMLSSFQVPSRPTTYEEAGAVMADATERGQRSERVEVPSPAALQSTAGELLVAPSMPGNYTLPTPVAPTKGSAVGDGTEPGETLPC